MQKHRDEPKREVHEDDLLGLGFVPGSHLVSVRYFDGRMLLLGRTMKVIHPLVGLSAA
jgi:hypothetical protein